MTRCAQTPGVESSKRLVLFDGVCNFCNASVLFVIDRDPAEHFVFAAQQSDLGEETLRAHGLSFEADPGLVLVQGARVFTHSTAVLRIARGLRWPWPLVFYLFSWIPRALRDALYRSLIRHRYAWFGKSDQCRIPTPELRRRIVA